MLVLTSTETLFGGLLAVIALFWVARTIGLSHYWSSVLASVLPFLVYLGYSSVVWQGGDMLAIHLAVFVATSAVLGVFGANRRSKEEMHWGPKLIASFFVVLTVFMAILLTISSHGLPDKLSGLFLPNPDSQRLHTAFPGVIPHDQNNLYEQHMQRVEEQRNLGWKVDISGLNSLHSRVAGKITVNVQDAQAQLVKPEEVTLALWRMANSGDDRHVHLKPLAEGGFGGDVLVPDPGKWLIEVTVKRGQDTFVAQQSMFVDESIQK